MWEVDYIDRRTLWPLFVLCSLVFIEQCEMDSLAVSIPSIAPVSKKYP